MENLGADMAAGAIPQQLHLAHGGMLGSEPSQLLHEIAKRELFRIQALICKLAQALHHCLEAALGFAGIACR